MPQDARTNRFCNWTVNSGYYNRQGATQSPFQTDQKINTQFDVSNTAKSYAILKDQMTMNKNQVVRPNAPKGSTDAASSGATGTISSVTGRWQNPLKKTVQMDTYIDQKQWVNIIQNAKDENVWREQFNNFSLESDSVEASVKVADIRQIVANIFGVDCPSFVSDKFDKVAHDIQRSRFVRFDDFRMQIPRIMAAVEAECTQKAETPGLIKLMNRPRLVDKNMGPLGDVSTVYRDTIVYRTTNDLTSAGKTMSLTPSSPSTKTRLPKTVAAGDEFSKPSNPTNALLGAGTTKSTNQIPGYTGHIPRNLRNLVKAEHAFGAIPHPVQNDLILTQANMGTTLNYTGHVSKYIATFGDRTTACDPRTSNGASYGPVRCML